MSTSHTDNRKQRTVFATFAAAWFALVFVFAFLPCSASTAFADDEADDQPLVAVTELPAKADEIALFEDLDESQWYLSKDEGTVPGTDTLFIELVVKRGIMLGYQDKTGARTKFGPDDPVTRGQVVTMLYRLSHPDSTDTTDATAYAANGTQLPDVADNQYFTAAVNWAVEAGIVSGYRDAVERYYSFGADDPITREQLATMVGRFCVGYAGMKATMANIDSFSDFSAIRNYAKAGVQFCVASTIMTGYAGTHLFGPGDNATRSQMAKVMALVVTLTDDDEDIAANGWPTDTTWRGGSAFPAPAPSNWVYEGGAWRYRNDFGTYATGMMEINGNKVRFDDAGKMTTGWYKAGDGSTYYFADNGIAAKGWMFIGDLWHYFDEGTSVLKKTVDSVVRTAMDHAQGRGSATSFFVAVDRAATRAIVLEHGADGWNPIQNWTVAVGAPESETPTGDYVISGRGFSFDGDLGGTPYTCYFWTNFLDGIFLFHSLPYYQGTWDVQDGRLGGWLSHGCVRLATENAQWIHDNVPDGTHVFIYN